MKLAVQIVLFHSSKHLAPLLESLKAQTFQDFEVFFYDNSCDSSESERSRALIESCGLRFTFYVGETNTGFTAHNNLFAQHDAPYVFVLNDDTLLDPPCLERLVSMMESDHKVAAVTPLVFRISRSDLVEAVLPVVSDDSIVDTAGHEYRLLADIRDIGSEKTWGEMKGDLAKSGPVFGVSGTAALYRRKAVLAVSPDATLYDPTFFMYKEDVDLDLRLARGGWKAWRASGAIVFHARTIAGNPSATLSRLQQERRRSPVSRRYSYRNTHHLYTYHSSLSLALKDLIGSFFFELMRSLGVVVASPSVWFCAVADVIRALPDAIARRRRMEAIGLKHIRFLS